MDHPEHRGVIPFSFKVCYRAQLTLTMWLTVCCCPYSQTVECRVGKAHQCRLQGVDLPGSNLAKMMCDETYQNLQCNGYTGYLSFIPCQCITSSLHLSLSGQAFWFILSITSTAIFTTTQFATPKTPHCKQTSRLCVINRAMANQSFTMRE